MLTEKSCFSLEIVNISESKKKRDIKKRREFFSRQFQET